MSYEQVAEMFRRLDNPPTPDERRGWDTPRLVAQVWCCGDDLDGLCYQPQIDRVTPNTNVGYPWVKREAVWRGTFVNEPDPDEYARLTTELREGASLHSIPLAEREHYFPYGVRSEAGPEREPG